MKKAIVSIHRIAGSKQGSKRHSQKAPLWPGARNGMPACIVSLRYEPQGLRRGPSSTFISRPDSNSDGLLATSRLPHLSEFSSLPLFSIFPFILLPLSFFYIENTALDMLTYFWSLAPSSFYYGTIAHTSRHLNLFSFLLPITFLLPIAIMPSASYPSYRSAQEANALIWEERLRGEKP